ncbi:response regulator transcription factor [Pantoea sp.]|uniref:response regulator transcription factor n=1 Tax=Pantoea sp. TaxID=69393 RepID=UPI0031D0E23E
MRNRVIIYDNHPLMVEGLSQVMIERGNTIAGAISDPEELMRAMVLDIPSLLIMDMQGLSEQHLKQLKRGRKHTAACRWLVFASCDSSWHAIQRLKLDVQGYLNKSCGPELFHSVLNDVEQGKKVMVRYSDPAARNHQDSDLIAALTHRERQILHELGAGKTNSVIAGELKLSAKTVSTYKRSIMQKMQTRKVCDVVDLARRSSY